MDYNDPDNIPFCSPKPTLPISSCPGPGNAPSSTNRMPRDEAPDYARRKELPAMWRVPPKLLPSSSMK